jgi:uncharacterized protein (TIGR02145 family)
MKSLFAFLLIMIIATGTAIFSQTVTIGTQEWTTKNLDVSTFRNGDPIPEAKTDEEWKRAGELKQPAWCYYDNDSANGEKYGKLYNWYAVNDARGMAPSGYHVPTDVEWKVLADFLGGRSDAGGKMKSMPIYEKKIRYVKEGGYDETKWVPCNNCSYWTEKQKANNPCTVCRNQGGKTIKTGKYIPKRKRKIEEKIQIGGWNGTNESGFSGLPGGIRSGGPFLYQGSSGYWWSASEDDIDNAYYRYLSPDIDDLFRSSNYKEEGFSVRCLRD